MTDRLEAMSILSAVVEAGSLSAGARAMRMPLATVSRKVAELETGLGAQLLLRSARGLTLTDTGEAYLEAARRILEDVLEKLETGNIDEAVSLLKYFEETMI